MHIFQVTFPSSRVDPPRNHLTVYQIEFARIKGEPVNIFCRQKKLDPRRKGVFNALPSMWAIPPVQIVYLEIKIWQVVVLRHMGADIDSENLQ